MTVEKFIPQLRFPQFQKEWEEIPLNKLLSFKNGLNASNEQYGVGTKFIHVSDILDNDYITYDNIIGNVQITDKEFEKYKIEYGDIVFQRSSENREEVGTANVYLSKRPCIYGGFVIRGKKKGEYDPYFLKELLQSTRVRKEITSWSGGSTRYNIGQDTLNKISIIMPPINEQTLISKFICSINKKLQLLKENIQYYQDFKKYLMQQFFNQKLRFKNYSDDWRTVQIKDIFDERIEKGFSELELLSVTLNDGVIKRSEIETKDNSNENKSNYKHVLPEDIVYNSMRMWQGASGVSSYEGIVSPAYTILIPKNVYSPFFGYYFKTHEMLYQFKKYSQGLTSDTWNLKYPLISKIEIKIPSIEEQKEISKILEAIDIKIGIMYNNFNEMTDFKKGLLQQMFV